MLWGGGHNCRKLRYDITATVPQRLNRPDTDRVHSGRREVPLGMRSDNRHQLTTGYHSTLRRLHTLLQQQQHSNGRHGNKISSAKYMYLDFDFCLQYVKNLLCLRTYFYNPWSALTGIRNYSPDDAEMPKPLQIMRLG